MGIFSRLSDIVNSNVTAILDRAEDPAKMIRLIIVEMEDTLVEVRSSAARAIAERKEVERSLGRYRAAQDEWAHKAEIALSKGREDLSRAALMEKSKLAEETKMLEDELTRLDDALVKAESDIVRLQEKLTEAKAKQKALVARHETASNRLRVRRTLHDGRIDDAFARFEQVEKRLDAAEGQVEAFDLGRGKSLHQEIAELESESAIEQELARLKEKLTSGGAGR